MFVLPFDDICSEYYKATNYLLGWMGGTTKHRKIRQLSIDVIVTCNMTNMTSLNIISAMWRTPYEVKEGGDIFSNLTMCV